MKKPQVNPHTQIKPILFNTQMVRAIVDSRKTKTRRPIQYNRDWNPLSYGRDKFYKTVDILNGRPGLWAGFYKNSDVFLLTESNTLMRYTSNHNIKSAMCCGFEKRGRNYINGLITGDCRTNQNIIMQQMVNLKLK